MKKTVSAAKGKGTASKMPEVCATRTETVTEAANGLVALVSRFSVFPINIDDRKGQDEANKVLQDNKILLHWRCSPSSCCEGDGN